MVCLPLRHSQWWNGMFFSLLEGDVSLTERVFLLSCCSSRKDVSVVS